MNKPAIGTCIVRFDGAILMITKALCDVLGYREENLVARKVFDIISPLSLDDMKAALNRFEQKLEGAANATICLISKNDEMYRVRAIFSGCCGIENSLSIMFIPLSRRTDEDCGRNNANSSAVYSLHEINNVVNRIVCISNYLAMGTSTEEQSLSLCGTLKESADLLVKISREMVSEAKNQMPEERKELFDLRDLVGKIVHPFLVSRKNSVTLNVVLDDNLQKDVFGEKFAIEQILINLLNNAVKFTEHGSVNLSVKVLNAFVKGKFVFQNLLFSVEDTGIGIDPAKIDKLFQDYSRLEPQYEGSGLGLCICKKLVERMGGNIAVASIPGRGSTFTFTINLPAKIIIKKATPQHIQQLNLDYCCY